MSSAAAAVLAGASTAASGIVRRARVNSLDGMTRGFRVVSPSGPAAGGTRGRSRSLTSDGLSACYTSGAAKCVTARGRDALEVGLGGGRGGASGAGGAGAGTGEGGQFLAGGRGAAAAAALAVFAATPDSGENEWGHDKTGGGRRGSGGLLGGRSNDTAWCHVQQPTPPVPSQQEQQQQQRRQLSPPSHEHRAFRATVARGALGAADHNSISSSSSSGSIGHRCRPSEADDFRAQKNLESFRAMKLDGGSTSTMVAATASLGVAGTPQQQQQQQQQPEGPARITDVYDFDNNGQPVGRGNRSTVSTATHRLTGQPVAVKRMLRSETSRSQVRKREEGGGGREGEAGTTERKEQSTAVYHTRYLVSVHHT